MNEKLRTLLLSFPMRLLVVLIVGLPIAAFAGDFLYTPVASGALDASGPKLAAELEGETPPPEEILRTIDEHGLSWLYITDAAGKTLPGFKAFTPDIANRANSSRLVSWHNKRYYEATADLKGHVVHAGYLCEPLWGFFHTGKMPSGFAIYLVGTAFVLIAGTYIFCVAIPMRDVVGRLRTIAEGRRPPTNTEALAAGEIGSLESELRRVLEGIIYSREAEVNEMRTNLNELMIRERQERFVNKLATEVQGLESSNRVCDTILHRVHDNFPNLIKVALAYKCSNGDLTLSGQLGMTSDQLKPLRKLSGCEAVQAAMMSGECTLIQGVPPEIVLPKMFVSHTFIAPLVRNHNKFGALIFFLAGEETMIGQINPTLKNVTEIAIRPLPTLVALERQLEEARRDELTGVCNRKFLTTYLQQLSAEMQQGERISMFIVEGDNFMALNEKYGRQAGDTLIKELCRLVCDVIAPDDETISGLRSMVFRYSAAQFLAVLRGCDAKKAVIIAERMRATIEQYHDWPAAVPQWTVSVGMASLPEDATSLTDLLSEADSASAYLRQNKQTNFCLPAAQVPKPFKSKRNSAVSGQLEAFEPASLLQSMCAARGTGVLDVDGGENGRFVCYMVQGVPKKARIRKIVGDDAVFEFVTTFDDGNFKFVDLGGNNNADIEALFELGESSTLKTDIGKLLLRAHGAKEKYARARVAITKTNLFFSKDQGQGQGKFSLLDQLSTLPEKPNERETEVMVELFKMATGDRTLKDVLDKFDTVPRAILLPCAATLLEQNIAKLSALKVYAK
jgi:diguanylate cyclase (GGDEF)-like protein